MRSELSQCRQNGFSLFSDRKKLLNNLIKESTSLGGDSTKQQDWLNEFHLFNNGKNKEQKLAYITRFVYDNSNLINEILQFGQGKLVLHNSKKP